jgi:hypothetical protein
MLCAARKLFHFWNRCPDSKYTYHLLTIFRRPLSEASIRPLPKFKFAPWALGNGSWQVSSALCARFRVFLFACSRDHSRDIRANGMYGSASITASTSALDTITTRVHRDGQTRLQRCAVQPRDNPGVERERYLFK